MAPSVALAPYLVAGWLLTILAPVAKASMLPEARRGSQTAAATASPRSAKEKQVASLRSDRDSYERELNALQNELVRSLETAIRAAAKNQAQRESFESERKALSGDGVWPSSVDTPGLRIKWMALRAKWINALRSAAKSAASSGDVQRKAKHEAAADAWVTLNDLAQWVAVTDVGREVLPEGWSRATKGLQSPTPPPERRAALKPRRAPLRAAPPDWG